MVTNKSYLFSLDYGNRVLEKKFIADILDNFNRDTLTGCMMWINNNPYSFEFYLSLNFQKDVDEFEDWLRLYYPKKERIYNVFTKDFFQAMASRGYNGMGLSNSSDLDIFISSHENELFLFPDRNEMNNKFGQRKEIDRFTVFLSHSSKNKSSIENVFNELQKSEISCWFDQYEISPGDSITDKINDGLAKSDLGLLFLSKAFLNSDIGWTMAEANYFFQRKMNTKDKKFIVINLDLEHEELPPLVQDFKYINFQDISGLNEIVLTIKQYMSRKI